MKTFMLAGHETSAAMMTWAILQNQTLQDEMCREAKNVFPTFDAKIINRDELSKLVLSEACLRES